VQNDLMDRNGCKPVETLFSIPLPTFCKEKLWLNEHKEKNFIHRQ